MGMLLVADTGLGTGRTKGSTDLSNETNQSMFPRCSSTLYTTSQRQERYLRASSIQGPRMRVLSAQARTLTKDIRPG